MSPSVSLISIFAFRELAALTCLGTRRELWEINRWECSTMLVGER